MNLHSTEEAAAQLGCSQRTIQRYCTDNGVGQRVGRGLILSAADITRLKRIHAQATAARLGNLTPGNSKGH